MLKDALGTVEIANLIGMSRITVHGWIKKGELKASRTPGRHFRVAPADLAAFLKERGVAVPDVLRQFIERRCVAIGSDQGYWLRVGQLLGQLLGQGRKDSSFSWEWRQSALAALMAIGASPPQAVLLQAPLAGVNECDMIRQIKERFPQTRIVALCPDKALETTLDGAGDSNPPEAGPGQRALSLKELKAAGADEALAMPVSPEDVARRVRFFIQ